MSTRQLRKLQMLDAAAAAEEQSTGGSSDDLPETVRPKQRRKRTHKKVFEATDIPDDAEEEKPVSASPTSAKAGKGKSSQRGVTKPQQSAPKGKPKASRKGAVSKQEDDFEATLQQYAQHHLGTDVIGDEAEAEESETAIPTVATLFIADRESLDPRTERIRSFGQASVESLKPKHPQCPRFKPCALGSPDPNTWPPFDALGLRVVPVDSSKTKGTGLASTTLYSVDSSDSRFQAGSRALHGAAASGDIHVLVDVWHRFPYHLPTLVQLHRTFATMGDVGEAQRCLDMALYTAGTVLSPLLGRAGTSAMLLASPGATLLLETLKLGVHNALRKGCAKTALEVLKATFSADPQDTQRLLAIADYVAIRASAWSWLATVTVAAQSSTDLPIAAMPTWVFNAALGCRMLRDAAPTTKKKTAVAKMPPAVEAQTGDGGAVMLRSAVLRFPTAAIALADRAGHKLDASPWREFCDAPASALSRQVVEGRAQRHLMGIGAERSAELWKMPNATEFLAEVVAAVVADFSADPAGVLSEQRRELDRFPPGAAFEAVLAPYVAVTPDEAMGNFTGPAIPRELLEAGPTEEEMRREHDERALAGMDDDQRLMLERLEAAFGPLPPDVPAEQRMHIYEEMLSERVQQLGQDQNAVGLFLRTLLPWNTPRQLALQRALQQAGREDPAVARRREERRRAEENDVEFVTYSDDDEGDP